MENKFLVEVISPRKRKILLLLLGFWLVNLIWFWFWWLQSDHILSWLGILLCSIFGGWNTAIPFYYFYFVLRMRKPNPLFVYYLRLKLNLKLHRKESK
jgi:hypothetical protein